MKCSLRAVITMLPWKCGWIHGWSPVVHHFSSNWKELKTLVLTLRREVNRATPHCSNATMFHFTDNEVTYHVVTSGSSTSPGLHSLIHEIKMLELQLNCQLVCIHVPSTTIILQGADGLFTDNMGEKKVLWEQWVRCAMGLKSSPYQAVQVVMVAEEVIKGDRLDPDNVFRWDVVRLNLPGSEDYDPTLPWVSKVRMSDGKIAADLFIYVDDARSTGSNYEESRMTAQRTASTFNYLGIQDAARKR
jgi:hypothetical protein